MAGPSDLFAQSSRVVVGVMSGTSLDGIDVAAVRLEGSGRAMQVEVLATQDHAFPPALAAELRACADAQDYSVDAFCRLGPRLSVAYADAVRKTTAGLRVGVDLVGVHGQTVRHLPEPASFAGASVSGTLQLGSGPAMAALLGIPVVSDFRAADVALGGQGAPLVPYLDAVLLSSDEEDRVALNLGGIANITALPMTGPVKAFDTGPANMLIDAVCRRLVGEPFDRGGELARSGQVIEQVLARGLDNPFFRKAPPKSAGRRTQGADFGEEYADRFLAWCDGHSAADTVRTASELTVQSVVGAIRAFVPFQPEQTIVSGGGVRNRYLMDGLREHLGVVRPSDDFGVDSQFKEAMAFAVLAHEAANGVSTGLPAVTGASRPAVLGTLAWP